MDPGSQRRIFLVVKRSSSNRGRRNLIEIELILDIVNYERFVIEMGGLCFEKDNE